MLFYFGERLTGNDITDNENLIGSLELKTVNNSQQRCVKVYNLIFDTKSIFSNRVMT